MISPTVRLYLLFFFHAPPLRRRLFLLLLTAQRARSVKKARTQWQDANVQTICTRHARTDAREARAGAACSRGRDLSAGRPHLALRVHLPGQPFGHGKTTLFFLARKASRKVNRLPEGLLANRRGGVQEKGRRTRLPFSPSPGYCVRP